MVLCSLAVHSNDWRLGYLPRKPWFDLIWFGNWADIKALVWFSRSIGQIDTMGISGRFFQGFRSVRVWFLVFCSCSWGSSHVLVRVRFVFLFLVLGVLVLGVLVCSYSVLVPVLVHSCSGLVPFWSCSGPVLVLVLFWFWSCSWFCSVPGGSVRVPWGSGSGPVLGPVLGPFLFLVL